MSGSGGRISNGGLPIILSGVASIFSTLVSLVSLYTHLKQYRKPLMQRYVVRIMLMVPLYSIASWLSLLSFTAASFIDPIRDVYEAFVIYCFFNLLVNYLGGERSIIIMTHGREPKAHPFPLSMICERVDISDPYTFLNIKRGILQYAWLKPALALATVIMKATGTFQEGYIGLTSGYFWSGLLYNVSITLSLYCLAMFWVCLHDDLIPFRPVPKFLVIKLVIFASYWQGFLLSLFVFAGFIKDSPGYSSDNISLAIQDMLTCFEMPLFAIAHWYAFSVTDYCDSSIASARLPIAYAIRDSFGIGDLMVDSMETLYGKRYGYQLFDPGENVMAHADGSGRMSRIKEGLRYERGGKGGKYWVPKPTGPNHKTPLLNGLDKVGLHHKYGAGVGGVNGKRDFEERYKHFSEVHRWNIEQPVEFELNEEDEAIFDKARTMEYGDYNFPVIEVRRKGLKLKNLNEVSTSTHQAILKTAPKGQSLSGNKKGKNRSLESHPSRYDVRDLVVEDENWEQRERIRLRKEGGAIGHDEEDELKRFIHLSRSPRQMGQLRATKDDKVIEAEEEHFDEEQCEGEASEFNRSESRVAEDFEMNDDASDHSPNGEDQTDEYQDTLREALLPPQNASNPWR